MSASGKGGFDGAQIGGGPAPVQQPDIYTRVGGQQNVDSDPYTEGYQPPTASPMQPPQAAPMPVAGQSGGKSSGGKGGISTPYIPRPDIGPGVGIGSGPAPLDPNAPNPLGPEGQQPVTPQPPAGMPGGKSGNPYQGLLGGVANQFGDFAAPALNQIAPGAGNNLGANLQNALFDPTKY